VKCYCESSGRMMSGGLESGQGPTEMEMVCARGAVPYGVGVGETFLLAATLRLGNVATR
jgi:hypothetical protein